MHKIQNVIKRIISNPTYLMSYCSVYWSPIKAWIAYIVSAPYKNAIKKRNIWLIREKGTEARDNGFHLYKYVRELHPEINAYYIISKRSPDLKKIEKYENIIKLNSIRHYIYYLCAKVSISSQPYGASPEPAGTVYRNTKNIRRRDQVVVFLQHGVTKDELPHELDYKNTHFDFFSCSSEIECRFIQKTHGYPEENIKAVGLCRFDSLFQDHEVKKQILIMPTHRIWLHAANTAKEANKREKKAFEDTDFYRAYSSILEDKEFIDYIRKMKYKIIFYPHYSLQSFIGCFQKYANDAIVIADRHSFDVQKLLMESALLVTDFSSVFFDFAFMGKPELFYQFDETKYRAEHFKKGYFDYRLDGFGPVFDNQTDLIYEIKNIIDNGCVMKQLYIKRVNAFFTFRDVDNCQRTFNEIVRKAEGK